MAAISERIIEHINSLELEGKDLPPLKELPSLLATREEVKLAYLFGSRAMGYHRPDSDIDLAVLFRNEASSWARLDLEEELSQGMGRSVQVISLNERLTPRLLHSILAMGVIVKDNPERAEWEENVRQALEKKGMEEGNYRRQLLDSMEEMAKRIQRALPLLDRIDMEKVKRDEPEAIRDFVGTFLMLFEPLETIARRAANYAPLALDVEEEPTTLRKQMELMIKVLDLDDRALEQFKELVDLRNKIAHVYWDIAEIAHFDLRETKDLFIRLVSKLSVFIESERGRLN